MEKKTTPIIIEYFKESKETNPIFSGYPHIVPRNNFVYMEKTIMKIKTTKTPVINTLSTAFIFLLRKESPDPTQPEETSIR